MVQKKKLGRPPLPESEKQQYQRVALYPETHQKAKVMAEDSGENLIDWFETMVNAVESGGIIVNDEVPAKRRKFPFISK